jgi:hypothetical protein
MHATTLRDRLEATVRAMTPDFARPISMWDLLCAAERAEHEQILRPQADAWAASHQKLKRPAVLT